MVSLRFLKDLDFYSTPVKIFFTKTVKKSEKKKYKEKLGSYIGFFCSFIIACLICIYSFDIIKDAFKGLQDEVHFHNIHHGWSGDNQNLQLFDTNPGGTNYTF